MATLAAVTNTPALALLGEDGKLERSTEPFRRWYQDNEELCLASAELRRVLEGDANAAVMKLDGIAVDIAAMADRAGGRHVLLTLPTEELPSIGDAGGALLDGALDESPALVWLKDLDGRYVRVNARFTTVLGTSEERLLGRTDAELPPAETVDGPRVHDRGDEAVEEPLQLEYVVGPFQGRAALVVLRFPVGDGKGVPTLVCGVAAPSSEAQVARSEAARLLRIERWSRLDAESVRAELLADWDLLPDARGRSAAPAAATESAGGPANKEHQAAVAEARAERATAVAERDSALSANEKLTGELAAATARLAELERALKDAHADGATSDAEVMLAEQAAELERGLTRERERAQELERTLALVRERLGDDAEAARTEVQRARADAEAARTEVQRSRADTEAARRDLEKARADADALRAAVAAQRDAAKRATAALEREVKQARDQLAALERQQGADDSGAQLRASEKARVAAEAGLAEAVAERDAALKARVVLESELEQERLQVAALRESGATAEERIRDLAAGMERERVRAEALEQAQARAQALEAELRAATMRADKSEIEVDHWRVRVKQVESELERGQAQIQQLEDKLALGREQITELEAEAKAARGRIEEVERQLELGQGRIGALEAEVKVGRALADELEGQLDVGRSRSDELEAALEAGRTRIAELEDELESGRDRVNDLESELELARTRVEELEGELEARVEKATPKSKSTVPDATEPEPNDGPPSAPTATDLAPLEAVEQIAPAAGGVSWQPTAKRTLSASLARESVWRNVLKETVQVLGSEGGWDTVTAWLPDESNGLGCAATWTAHRGLDRFEALTLEVPVKRDGSLLDQALQAPHLTWLTDLDAVDDERLQTAAAHGMNSALLLPVRTGNTTIGLLELLTHDTIEPDAQIALSLEASALQLGRFGHLLSLGGNPS
jgi:PAS domain-containing protein/predicted  nucleic acid-binding Zn-ribbon protein